MDLWRRIGKGAAGTAGALSGNPSANILQQKRHTSERPLRGGIFDRCIIKLDDRIYRRVANCDPVMGGLQHFALAHAPRADQGGKRRGIAFQILVGAHASVSCSEAATSDSLRIASSTVRCRRWNSGEATML